MKYYLPVLSVLLLIAFSCKKVEVPQSKEDIMRNGKWKMELDSNGKGIVKEIVKYPVDTSKKIVDTIYTPSTVVMGNDYLKDSKGITVLNERGRATYNVHVYPWCKMDNYLEFKDGISGFLNNGADKCPNGEVTDVPIKWGFLDNYTRMYIYDAGDIFLGNDDVIGEVKELTSDKLTLRYAVYLNNEIPRRDTAFYTVTFKKM